MQNFPDATTDGMKFICNVCSERHLEIPPIFHKIRDKQHRCTACSTHHGPGTCVAAKTCEEAMALTMTASFSPVRIPMILCPSCNVRHIHLSSLPYPALQPGGNLSRSRRYNNEHGYSSGTMVYSQPPAALQATVNIGLSKNNRKKNKNKTITSSSTPSSTTSTITTTTTTSPTSISTTVATAVASDNSDILAIAQGISQGITEGIKEANAKAKAKLEQDEVEKIKPRPENVNTEDADSDSSSGSETTTFLDPDDSEFVGEYFRNHQEKI
jgi:hypothetical protein